jgi:catechol 2,3-dioxygenase-like lactoylglutathione lyase family enzyme
MLSSFNHLTLAVADLAAAKQFYQTVLGFTLLAQWPKGAYFLAGDIWLALIHDGKRTPNPQPDYTHYAWSVTPADFESVKARILASGATVWQPDTSEGQSLYFLDPSGHKLEIHASDLAARLAYGLAQPWEGLEVLVSPEQLLMLRFPFV